MLFSLFLSSLSGLNTLRFNGLHNQKQNLKLSQTQSMLEKSAMLCCCCNSSLLYLSSLPHSLSWLLLNRPFTLITIINSASSSNEQISFQREEKDGNELSLSSLFEIPCSSPLIAPVFYDDGDVTTLSERRERERER